VTRALRESVMSVFLLLESVDFVIIAREINRSVSQIFGVRKPKIPNVTEVWRVIGLPSKQDQIDRVGRHGERRRPYRQPRLRRRQRQDGDRLE